MGKLAYVLIVAFLGYAIYVCVKIVFSDSVDETCNRQEMQNVNNNAVKIQNGIEILNSSASSAIKAEAVVMLMMSAYILIHKQPNQGENYDDKKQSEKFQNSLNENSLAKLWSLEGNYE